MDFAGLTLLGVVALFVGLKYLVGAILLGCCYHHQHHGTELCGFRKPNFLYRDIASALPLPIVSANETLTDIETSPLVTPINVTVVPT
jgi:hypothetical protein